MFNFTAYELVDSNPDKHQFFSVIERSNDRMQHLAFLTRFLIFEENDGPADIRESDVMDYIEKHQSPDGNDSFKQTQVSKLCEPPLTPIPLSLSKNAIFSRPDEFPAQWRCTTTTSIPRHQTHSTAATVVDGTIAYCRDHLPAEALPYCKSYHGTASAQDPQQAVHYCATITPGKTPSAVPHPIFLQVGFDYLLSFICQVHP
jgi:hypothetical protein